MKQESNMPNPEQNKWEIEKEWQELLGAMKQGIGWIFIDKIKELRQKEKELNAPKT